MTDALHRVTSDGADRSGRITQTHVHWIRGMAKVVHTSIDTILMTPQMIIRRRRKPETRCRHGFTRSFESDDRKSVCKTQQTSSGTTKGVARNPYIGIRVQVSHIVVKILDGVVVSVFLSQFLDQAGGVARVCRRHTTANLPPHVLPSLTTTTAEEEVVVDLVVCGSF